MPEARDKALDNILKATLSKRQPRCVFYVKPAIGQSRQFQLVSRTSPRGQSGREMTDYLVQQLEMMQSEPGERELRQLRWSQTQQKVRAFCRYAA
jgi:hypothetical protein